MKHDWKRSPNESWRCTNCKEISTENPPAEYGCSGKKDKNTQRTLF